MNKFAASWASHQERVLTENGAETFDTSANANVDLFFTVGALRGQPVDKLYRYFAKAFGENPYIATRIMLWARDVRGGAGERKIFRDLLKWLEVNDPDVLSLVIPKVPEIGRWDDLLVLETSSAKTQAFDFIAEALNAGNEAKQILSMIDTMNEEDCQKILNSYNDRSGNVSYFHN